jgi:hypothetical protein
LGVACLAADAKPEHIYRNTGFDDFQLRRSPHRRMPAIAADHQVSANTHLGVAHSTRHHSCDPFAIPDQIDSLMLHKQVECRELPGLPGEEIQKIPLRHQSDELAVRRHVAEIWSLEYKVAERATGGSHLLVRKFQEFIEQVKFVEKFESRRVDSIAAEIAEEIAVLLKDGNV